MLALTISNGGIKSPEVNDKTENIIGICTKYTCLYFDNYNSCVGLSLKIKHSKMFHLLYKKRSDHNVPIYVYVVILLVVVHGLT